MDAAKPLNLIQDDLLIRTFNYDECDTLSKSLYTPNSWFERVAKLNSQEDHLKFIQRWFTKASAGSFNPIGIWKNGEVAGITCFHRFDVNGRFLEVGRTSFAQRFRRTPLNTQVKYLLMNYAFENLEANRVEFRVNTNNYTSQVAVLRIGAKFEGVIKDSFRYPDHTDDSLLYAVTKRQWPLVKANLIDRLQNRFVSLGRLGGIIDLGRFELRPYKITDSEELLNFINRNRKIMTRDFPKLIEIKDLILAQKFVSERTHEIYSESSSFYGCFEKDSRKLIGQFAIKNVDWNTGACELGYVMDSDYHRQGIAKAAVSKIINYLKEFGVRRFYVRICLDNPESFSFAEKMGFQSEGIMRKAFKTGYNELVDYYQLSKLI